MHKAVARGSIDLGVVLQPAMLGMIPMLQGVYLPFAFDSVDQIAKVYEGESLEIIQDELEKRNLELVYPSFLDGVQVFSNEKNLETVEDFDGLRILSTSPMFSKIMDRLGAAPDTSIPQDEQYMALKRGVAEAMANSTVGGYFQKSHEVAPYYTKIDMSYAVILVCANKRTWEKIPEDIRQLMVEEGRRAGMRTLEISKGWEKKFIGEMEKEDATITYMPEEERQKIKEIAEPVWLQWADKNGETAKRLLELSLGLDVK
ncbi:MAG: TRAP transporter substrate-binding protein [Desulfosalsimonas sp.]